MSKYSFAQAPTTNVQRSVFDRSYGHKTTIPETGDLIPFYVDEVLPGDSINLRTSGFARMSTPLHPLMDNVYAETFYFFCPNRIIWKNWEKCMGVQYKPNESTDYLVPQLICPAGGWTEGSFEDFLGLPTKKEGANYSALFRRAHNRIWYEWFRDSTIQGSQDDVNRSFNVDDGPDYPTIDGTQGGTYLKNIRSRGKRHDYFTSCLPSASIENPVSIPVEGTGPVLPGGADTGNLNDKFWLTQTNTGLEGTIYSDTPAGSDTENALVFADANIGPAAAWQPNLIATIDATTTTINQLRQAMQLQVFYERDMRAGRRYSEMIAAHFGGTRLPDNQWRPEYLGGGHTEINTHVVANQTDGITDKPLGELGAFATASFQGHGFNKSFAEHGIVIGYVSFRAEGSQIYQQGMHRMFTRRDRLDFYWSTFNQIGDQATLVDEIWFDDNGTQDANGDPKVFGYNERFSEYKYRSHLVTGQFRSNAQTPLDTWHTAQNFETEPALNYNFMFEPDLLSRVLATPDEPHFIADFFHKIRHTRIMPVHAVPTGLGRF